MEIWRLDKSLSLLVLFFVGLGLVQVYSSSFLYAFELYSNGYHFFYKQFIFSILGMAVFFASLFLPWEFWQKYGIFVWLFSLFLLILTFMPNLGVSVGGSRRWLYTPFGFRIEPSELFKISLPFLVAFFLSLKKLSMKIRLSIFSLFSFCAVLLIKQPDFGSLVISSMIIFTILFVFGLQWKWLFAILLSAGSGFLFLIITSPYRYARLRSFLDPWADPMNSGFQVIQSFLSFNSGGLLGVGPGGGQSKLLFLPEAHTDFTFSVLAEEWGFLGVAFILFLTATLTYIGFQIVSRTKEKFVKIVAFGLVLNFTFSVLVNSGVVMGLLPTKGLTFPFLSYGGSSLLTLCWGMGVLVSIERYNIRKEKKQKPNAFSW